MVNHGAWCVRAACVLLAGLLAPGVSGHGRLLAPVARSSRWRVDDSAPINYDDNELYCGGFNTQYYVNNGMCGECGDNFADARPRANENTGTYGTGDIVATYTQGQQVRAAVQITAHHKGYFEFFLCPLNASNDLETEDCFRNNKLSLVAGGDRYTLPNTGSRNYTVPLWLPAQLVCQHCVFRWKYHAGNNWGTDPVTGMSGLGLGNQEEFYGCADVKIVSNGGVTPTIPTNAPTPSPTPTPTSNPGTATPAQALRCHAVGPLANNPGMDEWCENNCFNPEQSYCPANVCSCTGLTPSPPTPAPGTGTNSGTDSPTPAPGTGTGSGTASPTPAPAGLNCPNGYEPKSEFGLQSGSYDYCIGVCRSGGPSCATYCRCSDNGLSCTNTHSDMAGVFGDYMCDVMCNKQGGTCPGVCSCTGLPHVCKNVANCNNYYAPAK